MSQFPPPSTSPVAVSHEPPQTSGMAIASLIFGILGLMSCALLGIVAIILGNNAQNEIRASHGRIGGEGLAKAGIITGWIGVALMVAGLVITGLVFLFMIVVAAGSAAAH